MNQVQRSKKKGVDASMSLWWMPQQKQVLMVVAMKTYWYNNKVKFATVIEMKL